MNRPPNQDDAALYLRLHALKDAAVQAEARAWFFERFGRDVTCSADGGQG